MITQRLTGDQGAWAGTLTITNTPGDANGWAELQSLQEELKLRANVRTEGSVIVLPRPEDVPPPPPAD
jgi:hypothetical protein